MACLFAVYGYLKLEEGYRNIIIVPDNAKTFKAAAKVMRKVLYTLVYLEITSQQKRYLEV